MATPRWGTMVVMSALAVAGCHHRLPPEPLVSVMPGPYKTADEYQLDITSCQQFAQTEMRTMPRAAGRPQVRLDAAYAECMAQQGNRVPGYPEPLPMAYNVPRPIYRKPVRPVARPVAPPVAAAAPIVPGPSALPPAGVAPPNWVAPVATQ
jgi:hypothetical protein